MKNVKCITIQINGIFRQINLNSKERIENEDDLNLLPFLFYQNARKKVKKARRTIKNKNIKQRQNKDEIIYDNSNDIFEENLFIDNSTVNETQLID